MTEPPDIVAEIRALDDELNALVCMAGITVDRLDHMVGREPDEPGGLYRVFATERERTQFSARDVLEKAIRLQALIGRLAYPRRSAA